MDSEHLDVLLRAYSKQPLPPAPAPDRLTSGVWREIEQHRPRRWWAGMFPVLSWRELFAEPRLAAAGLAIALFVGVLPAAVTPAPGDNQIARDSLHFNVFSTHSPGMPATLLAMGVPNETTGKRP